MTFGHLGPGSQVPGWIEDLDRLAFGDPFGPLEELEHLWFDPGAGFARWRVLEAVGEAELLRVAVAPGARRSGRGRALLRHCARELGRLGIATLLLEVRVSNLPARRLYEAEAWVAGGVRKAYYRDGEDALLYARELTGP
jgi:ribosomal protein S18 acetylase RimI-like enzyme